MKKSKIPLTFKNWVYASSVKYMHTFLANADSYEINK